MRFDAYSGPVAPGGVRLDKQPGQADPVLTVHGKFGRGRRLERGVVDALGSRYLVVDAWHLTGTPDGGQAQFVIAVDEQDTEGGIFAVATVDASMAEQLRSAGLPQRLAFTFVVLTGVPAVVDKDWTWVGRQLARMATNGILPVPVEWTDSDRVSWALAAKVVADIAEAEQGRTASG